MARPQEVELKLEVPPACLPGVGKLRLLRAAESSTKTEVSIYFDTDEQALRTHGLMLRVRRMGKRRVQTIKATRASQLLGRDEWEAEIASDTPDLRLARGTALEPLLSRKLCRRLKPVFETRIRRKTFTLADDSHAVEIALDKGRIATGRRSRALCEVELELKRGGEDKLFDVARKLVAALPAQLAVKSKSERGYELLEGQTVSAAKAEPLALEPGMNAADGLRAIGHSCLKQVAANVAALRAGDAEGVHQMRVGLRRLRAAMSLFREILPDPETAAVKREIKWLTGELARAREFEVLVERVVLPVKRHHPRLSGMASVAHDLDQQREAALERAQNAVRSARFRRLLIEIAAWLETGKWLKPQDDLLRERTELSVATFAATELTRRWKKFRKRGKKLRKLDRRGRHKLRIQGKKLRYASEFFACLFAGGKASRRRKSFLSRLEHLQDRLGDLNDIVVHEQLITASAGLNRRTKARAGNGKHAFASGLLSGHEDARFAPALAGATKAFAAVAKVKPFW